MLFSADAPDQVATVTPVRAREGVGAVVGPPGPLMAWFCVLLQQVERLAEGRVVIEELRPNLDLRPESGRLRIFIGANSSVIEPMVGRGDMPTVIIIDDLRKSVEFLCSTGMPFLHAMRIHTAALVLAPALRGNTRARILTCNAKGLAANVADTLVRHFGLELSPAAREDVFNWLVLKAEESPSFNQAFDAFRQAYGFTDAVSPGLSSDQDACIRQTLAPMLRMMGGGPWPATVWSVNLMLAGDSADQPAKTILSLVGPPRCLLYGPSFHLPRGRYEVQCVFGLTLEAQDMTLAIELVDDQCRARAIMKPKSEGLFRGRFYYEQTRPDLPLSIRLLSEESAIDGHLGFSNVSFFPLEAL